MASFYAGSRLLTPVGQFFGLPIDQVNFLACQFTAVGLAYPFRVHLSPQKASVDVRHMFEIVVGVTLISFCFGHQIVYILGQSLGCFFLIQTLPRGLVPKAVFAGAMLQLCVCHIWRQMYDYGGYTMDITGPLMINTQRVTSLAWSLADGEVKDVEKLTVSQRRLAVKKIPTFLELMSYTFNFHGAMVGPFCFYIDYINFIEGTNLVNPAVINGSGLGSPLKTPPECPSPKILVAKKLLSFGVCALLVVFVIPIFSINYLSDPAFLNANIPSKFAYIIICTTVVRPKYYLAWKLAEACNNNAGLGFYYNERGEGKWDLVDNARIRNVELSTSIKMLLDNWNITTTFWLRHVVYERVHTMNTMSVFVVSSLWHGFYPGYYLTFLSGAIFVPVARLIRRNFRASFQTSEEKHILYEILTFLATRITIAYMTFPFVYLEFAPSWEVYRRLYCCLHILALVVIGFYSLRPKRQQVTVKAS